MKLVKSAAAIKHLQGLVLKHASEAQKSVTGTPGKDTKPQSTSEETETVNKNSVKSDNLPQGASQQGATDKSEPAKTAMDLSADVLSILAKAAADAQDTVVGEPGKDTNPESTSEKTETTDKNAVKADKNTQKVEQHAASDASAPAKGAKKTAEELEEMASKVASYQVGRELAAAVLKEAAVRQQAEQFAIVKEAGRRDFEQLIVTASQQLGHQEAAAQEKTAAAQDQVAAAQGAAYFDDLAKTAQLNQLQAELAAANEKLASYEAFIKEAQELQAVEAQAAAQEKLADVVADRLMARLNAAPAPAAGK